LEYAQFQTDAMCLRAVSVDGLLLRFGTFFCVV
jgi:hypothetical protein